MPDDKIEQAWQRYKARVADEDPEVLDLMRFGFYCGANAMVTDICTILAKTPDDTADELRSRSRELAGFIAGANGVSVDELRRRYQAERRKPS